ncbi:hypothetical protein ACQEPV_022500 [Xanthomonas oryzae pv. oryzicola]
MTSEPRRALPAFPALRWSFSAGRELEEELLDPKKTSNSTHFISPGGFNSDSQHQRL